MQIGLRRDPIPLMLAEAATAAALLWLAPDSVRILVWGGLAPVVLIWLSTWAVQVPTHRLLTERFDAGTHRALVRTNWLRTIAWSLRAVAYSPPGGHPPVDRLRGEILSEPVPVLRAFVGSGTPGTGRRAPAKR